MGERGERGRGEIEGEEDRGRRKRGGEEGVRG